ncbi:achaete-scute homolog 1-like [Amphibalanus amphitrite]|uniref:achaete-scute homolog 1-like n=1 Tax=Amphibalanus amphitrite TaxID=1232801 RepID=UPI001C9037EF|nr:achaete-scute homolog 1-like [Amphibalanus amphitrite]
MSTTGTVPIRPSPQKPATACVLLAPAPVGSRSDPTRGPRRPLPPPPGRNVKRRGAYSSYVPSPQPTNVLRRNARERNRVKQVNHGFTALRNHIPGAAKNKKLSKVDTLRRAMEYIQSLQRQLEEHAEGRLTPQQQPSPSYPTPPAETAFSGYLPPTEGSPSVSTQMTGYLSPPGYLPAHDDQSGGYLTPQSSPVACQPSPLTLTPSSLASVDSGVGLSESMGYPLGAAHPCPDTPSPTPTGQMTAEYAFREELSCQEPEPDLSPEDEELLDAIAWWQTSQ